MSNQLAHEKSPYLLQHQDNPVDWLPWGDAAFARAHAEDKPIFLSIGYSTCHWCHVMERECFEVESVAAVMNQHFINIKVDREERPDVDRLYMTFIQAATGSGGWPMSVFLTPDLKPFYGGTYFPPDSRYGRPGFKELLANIAEAWRKDRAGVVEAGSKTLQSLQRYADVGSDGESVQWDEVLDECYSFFRQTYDKTWGGFGEAPKFPRPVQHDFLHLYFAMRGERPAIEMSRHTLHAMSNGGINDQLGGGFHRYSVDEQWIVSHFEKMLYDQAQLVVAYLEMYQLTHEAVFAQTAASILEYVRRDMTHPDGGFYSAEDADSYPSAGAAHKDEGAFYVWTAREIRDAVGEADAAVFNAFYGVREQGNAPPQGDPQGEFRGKNILYRAQTVDAIAASSGRDAEAVEAALERARARLLDVRNGRPRPHLDDKIITAWNGLMIAAFARAAAVLDEPSYLTTALAAAAFVRRELFDASSGTLRRHYRDGAAAVAGFADDYAFLARGLLDVYEASGDLSQLLWAESLMDVLHRDFWDEKSGGYFNSAPDPHVLIRMKEDYDGAEPSANSVAALNCLRLAQLLGRDDLRERAEAILDVFGHRLQHAPHAMPELLCAKMYTQEPPLHIVIVGEPDADDTRALLQIVYEQYLPHKSVLLLWDRAAQDRLAQRLPFIAGLTMLDDRATAYVCRDFACRQPLHDPQQLQAELAP